MIFNVFALQPKREPKQRAIRLTHSLDTQAGETATDYSILPVRRKLKQG